MAAELDERSTGNGAGPGETPGVPSGPPTPGPLVRQPDAPFPTPDDPQGSVPPPSPVVSTPPPPGWYADIFGNPPRWWDGTVWTEHLLVPLSSQAPAGTLATQAQGTTPQDDIELSVFDNALISLQLAPDWAKLVAAALLSAVLALIALGLLSGDDTAETPDGFFPDTPTLEDSPIQVPSEPTAP